MALLEWVSHQRENAKDGGLSETTFKSLYDIYLAGLLTVSSRFELGTNVYSRDWDLLVVLDACRVDALREVADEYEFLGSVESIWSVGSSSDEWMAQTFIEPYDAEVQETSYVTYNNYTKKVLHQAKRPPLTKPVPGYPNWRTVSAEDFGHLDEVWRYAWDDDVNHVRPSPVTERAIHAARNRDLNRQIVHYGQPHAPYLGERSDEATGTLWPEIMNGEIEKETVWEHYIDNLRLVLDEVAVLLENVDAPKTIITADHGEAFGEFGLFKHPPGVPHPVIRKVPWAATEATDEGEYEVELTDPQGEQVSDEELEDRLELLGYRV